MHRRIIFAVLLLIVRPCHAAFERLPLGARDASLCDASTLSADDVFGWGANPALLGRLPASQGAFGCTPAMFGLPDLHMSVMVSTVALDRCGFGALVEQRGNALYREATVEGGVGVLASDRVRAGTSLSVYHLHIEGYGQATAVALHLGLIVCLADQFCYGVALRNANAPHLGHSGEIVGRELVAGTEFEPLPGCRLMATASKTTREPINLSMGAEYWVEHVIALRFGADGEDGQVGFGLSADLGSVRCDYGVTIHQELGMTHSFALQFFFP